MCGIAGTYRLPDKNLLERMCNVIEHRGPDDVAYYVDDTVSLGMRRLSIIDLKKGIYPLTNEKGTVFLIFNGEIYNHIELRRGLEQRNHQFKTKCDAEVIVHLYEDYGLDFPRVLNGMFAIALWDSEKKLLVLVRDRLGKKPLYYTMRGDVLLFASEIKSLLQLEEVPREVDTDSLSRYLTFNFVPAPKTMFKGINKLKPAHGLAISHNSAREFRYWSLPSPQSDASEEFFKKKIEELLRNAVKLRLMSDVPLGAYLSGGVDSSVVVSLMSQYSQEPVKTFSVGFGEGDDELEYAKHVSERFGTDHHEISVPNNSVNLLPKIAWHLDEPINDPAAIPVYILSEFAKKKVTVVLTGEGGDEQFAGYTRYKLALKHSHFGKLIPKAVSQAADYVRKNLPESNLERKLGYISTLHSRHDAYLRYVSIFTESEKKRLLLWPDKTSGVNISEELAPSFADGQFIDKMLAFDIKNLLPEQFLMKVDKMTMAHSVEARAPLLDYRLVELSASIPGSMKIVGDVEKAIFRDAVRNHLPQQIANRKKHGFAVPIVQWLSRDRFPFSFLESSEAVKTYFSKDYISLMEQRSKSNHLLATKAWNLAFFALWHKIFIEGDPRQPELTLNKLV